MEHEGLPPFSIEPTDSASARWDRWVRRFDNFIVAKNVEEDTRKKAMLLHYAGESVFDLSESLNVLPADTCDQTKVKLNAYFTPRRNVEYEVFTFRQAKQNTGETLDQFHTRLQHLAKNCAFDNKDKEIKSQIVQKCFLPKIRDKGLGDANITLEQLLTYGRTLEATMTQSKIMGNTESTIPTTDKSVHAMSHDASRRTPSRGRGRGHRGSGSSHRGRQMANSRSDSQNPNKKSSQSASTYQSEGKTCQGCGGSPHNRKMCSAWGKTCYKCQRSNHFASVCKANGAMAKANYMEGVASSVTDDLCEETYALSLYHTSGTNLVKPYVCTMTLEGTGVTLEIDTGASVSLISEKEWTRIQEASPKLTLSKDNIPRLRTYAGNTIQPLGQVPLEVYHNNQHYKLPVLVVPGSGPNLLGRDWLSVLKINWATVHQVDRDDFLKPYQNVFSEELGTLKGVTAKFYVDDTVKPRYFKPRPVPLALRAKVEAELDRLQEAGVIRPVEYSEWAAPIVPVLKATGAVRICGDYKVTINQATKVDKYPIPNIDDLFTKLSGGQLYTKLDLSHAYQQVVLDEASRKLTTINTSKGLFVYERLPYGVSSSPGIFQRIMEQLLQNIPMTVVYLDDVLVTGRTPEDHDRNLQTVLTRLQEAGLHLKKEKCTFRQKSCAYLGHVIDAEGIHPTEDKVIAVQNAPAPQNSQELRSYLGLIHYYHNFLRNLSTLLAPLHELTRQNVEWNWGPRQQKAFDESKALLFSSKVLVHYNPELPIIVTSDASPYGIGSVLSHRLPDGNDRPIAFASRTLSTAEKKYAQLEKEGLALIYGISKFHKYLYGREFIVQTDHKPLLGLLKEDRPISAMASARIQRWALTLSNYQYCLEYRPGLKIGHADGLSRLPLPIAPTHVPIPEEVVLALSTMDETPITSEQIAKWTVTDPVLSQVRQYVEQGWPPQVPGGFEAYVCRKSELSVQHGVLMWGARVIIPPKGRETLLDELHATHPGIVKMKALARSYLWWPGVDADIERTVKDCEMCQLNSKLPPSAPLHPWEWPGQPWHRIHIDYAGPYEGKMILVIVDAHSKYIDAHVVASATTSVTLTKLRQTFATLGLPSTIVSDNGSCFTSDEFRKFCRINGIKNITSSPYHPASNGLAERAVQTVKAALKKTRGNLEDRLYSFLARYRVTPQGTTGQAPATFVFKSPPRTRLNLLRPSESIKNRVLEKQSYDKQRHDAHASARVFRAGDSVWAMNFQAKPKWVPAILENQLGPLTFTARLSDNRLWRRHQDHLRERRPDEVAYDNQQPVVEPMFQQPLDNVVHPVVPKTPVSEPINDRKIVPSVPVPTSDTVPKSISVPKVVASPMLLRRSTRVVKPPEKLDI